MVHVVKDRQYNASHIDAHESETDSRPRYGQISMLQQSQEMNSTAHEVQLLNFRSVMA